jgi:hypothetical protein
VKYVFGIAVLFAILGVGWQIGVAELHNFELQDDLKDLSAQMGFRTGAAPPLSDDDLRASVIRKAARYDIELAPQQVTVRRGGTSEYPTFFLAIDYTVRVNLLVSTYTLHFTPSSTSDRT